MFQLQEFFHVEHYTLQFRLGLHRVNKIYDGLFISCSTVLKAHFIVALHIDARADRRAAPGIVKRQRLIRNVAEHRFVGVQFVVGKYMGDNGKACPATGRPFKGLRKFADIAAHRHKFDADFYFRPVAEDSGVIKG